jgi:hypothetical protein
MKDLRKNMHAAEAKYSHKFALLNFLMVFVFLLSLATVRAADTIIDSKTENSLPAAGTAGRLVNLTDGPRGLWLDTGSQWVSVNGGMFNVRFFGATGDGSTDDAAAINAAVEAANQAGGGCVFFPSGTYVVGSAIKMRSNIQYVGSGCSSVIQAKPGTQDNLMGEASPLEAVSQVLIRDLFLDGNAANIAAQGDDTHQNAIRWCKVSYSRISNVFISNTVYNGISLYSTSNDNIIEKCSFYSIGKSGAVGAKNGIVVEFGSDRNKIQFNRILGVLENGIQVGESIGGATNYDNTVQGNVIGTCNGDGIRLGFESGAASLQGAKVIDNQIAHCGGNSVGIRIFMGSTGTFENALISGNIISNCANGLLLQGANIHKAIVTNNHIINSSGQGLRIEGEDCIVSNNISLNNPPNFTDAGTRTISAGNIVDATSGQFNILGKLAIGGGTPISRHLSAKTVWEPVSINNAAGTSTTLTVIGAQVGNTVAVGFATPVPAKAMLFGAVTSANTVTVTLMNYTGAALHLASGSLRADVWQH